MDDIGEDDDDDNHEASPTPAHLCNHDDGDDDGGYDEHDGDEHYDTDIDKQKMKLGTVLSQSSLAVRLSYKTNWKRD